MLDYFLGFLIIFLLYVCRRSTAQGCALLLVLHMLIPPCARVFSASFNTVCLFIVFIISCHQLMKDSLSFDKMLLWPIRYLVLPLAILAFFAPLAFDIQFGQLLQFTVTEILIFGLIFYSVKDGRDLQKSINCLLWAYLIIGSYGVLTYFIRFNPLYSYFAIYFDAAVNFTGDGLSALNGGMSGRATGNLSGPLPWGQVSLLMCVFAFCYPHIEKFWFRNAVAIVACLNCFFCTKRSVMVPMFILVLYVLLKKGGLAKKKLLKIIVCVPLIGGILWNIPQFQSYKKNIETALFFWDDYVAYKNGVSGSSKEMRLEQFNYTFVMVKDNNLCGLGYGYPGYYNSHYGVHPVLYSFESLFYQVVISSGFLGLAVWMFFFFKMFQMTSISLTKMTNLMFHGVYLLSLFMTGLQTSFFWYMVIVVFTYKFGSLRQNAVIDNNSGL